MAVHANSTSALGTSLSRRQAAIAGLGIFGAAIIPAALYPGDTLATDLGKPPEPEWPVAVGFDLDRECANVMAAKDRCAKGNDACAAWRAEWEANQIEDEAAWQIENDRVSAAWAIAWEELEAASRHYSNVKDGFYFRLLHAHGVGDLFRI